jgi:hypothetical protein
MTKIIIYGSELGKVNLTMFRIKGVAQVVELLPSKA